jgi:hypothetical protein
MSVYVRVCVCVCVHVCMHAGVCVFRVHVCVHVCACRLHVCAPVCVIIFVHVSVECIFFCRKVEEAIICGCLWSQLFVTT